MYTLLARETVGMCSRKNFSFFFLFLFFQRVSLYDFGALSRLGSSAYLGPRVRTVIDEDQGGGDVDDESEHGDEVGSEPEGHLADQPVPPGLQEAVQEALARTTVLVLAQPFQLAGRQQFLLVKLHIYGRCTEHRFNTARKKYAGSSILRRNATIYVITESHKQLR